MKRKKLFFYFLTVFALLIFILPYFTGLPFIRPHVERSISETLNINVSTGKIIWSWFPSPHLTVLNSTISDKRISVSIKDLGIFPNIPALFLGTIEVKKIEVDTPDIGIKSLQKTKLSSEEGKPQSERKEISLPSITVIIKNGHISLPVDGFLEKLEGKIPAPEISDININVLSTEAEFLIHSDFNTEFVSSVASSIRIIPPVDKLNTSEEYIWDMSIKAKDINLSEVRKILLLLLGDDKTVKDVCGDIVLGGRATEAEYTFSGKTSELGNFDQMHITAMADNVKVHIPDTNIYLENANGPIVIKDSILTGQGLSAQFEGTRGKNCNLKVGLGEEDHFNLDLDINADLSNLLPALDNFIDQPELITEIDKITHVEGSALAHLKLGNHLSDVQVNVSVSEISGSFYYDLLKRQVTIVDGNILFNSDSVSWDSLNGMIGPNTIHGSRGSVIWQKGIDIDIQNLDATINSTDFHEGLMAWPRIKKELSKTLTRIEGPIKIKEFTLKGALGKPKTMTYNFTIDSDELTFLSPGVAQPVTSTFENLKVSNNSLLFDQFHIDTMGQPLVISGQMKHTIWQNFKGDLELRGNILKRSEAWLKEKKWIPEMVFPKLPCRLEPLKITFNEQLVNISGRIIHPNIKGGNTTTSVDVDILDKKTTVKKLEITAGKQRAVTSVDRIESDGLVGLTAEFNGKISGDILNTILEKVNNFPDGYVKGNCRLISPLDPKGEIKYTGNTEISGISQKLPNGGKVHIGNALITGKSDRAIFKINELEYERPGDPDTVFTQKIGIPELQGGIYFHPEKKSLVKIFSGNLCGIHISGNVLLPKVEYNLGLKTGIDQTITFQDFLSCLGIKKSEITGNITVNAGFKGTPESVNAGHIVFRAKNGVIEKATLLTRILSLIDITELFSQNPVQHFKTSGYTYDSIEIDAEIVENKINITRAAIHGAGLNLFVTGSIDIETWIMDLVILAAPFKIVDSIITSLPLLKHVGGKNKSIITVPLKAKGPIGDPELSMLPTGMKHASQEILDTFKKTFEIPFNFSYQLVNPSKKKKSETNNNKNSD